LMYHRVNTDLLKNTSLDRSKINSLVVSVKNFRQQMRYLSRNGYTTISPKQFFNWVKLNKPLPKKSIIISFDDGYRDNFLNAFPVLKEFGFTATVFICPGIIGKDKKMAWCKDLNIERDMLNEQEIKEMANYGITFGSHTVNHPYLTQIDHKEAEKEIQDSRKMVSDLIGMPIDTFCYPYGDYNKEIKKLVKESGFDMAFTTNPGINNRNTDLYELRRREISARDSLFDFMKKLSGAYDLLHRAIQKKRKIVHRLKLDALRLGRLFKAHRLREFQAKRESFSLSTANPQSINLLYIIWSLGLGGAERVVINLAKGLDKTKFNPMVCCLNEKGEFANELENEGIKVIALNKKGRFDISVIFKLISIIRQYKIDIVHTHLWGANFWGRIAAEITRVSVVIATEHNVDSWKTKFYLAIDRWLSHSTEKIIAVSDKVKEFYMSKGIDANKIIVIHNGIDIKRYELALGNKKDKEITLAVMGRLVLQKGHRFFLMALKELIRSYKVKGLIIGSGPLEQELRQLSQNLGLNGNVTFTGLRQDIPDLLKTIDILVIPSLREGLPIIALEAMASGIPIVATKVGGNPEVVLDGQTGILVPAGDSMALAEAIERLIKDKNLVRKFSEKALDRIKEYFTLEKMVKETEEVYRECLTKNGQR